MTTTILLSIGLGVVLIIWLIRHWSKPIVHEDLELKAELLLLSHDVDEIKTFLNSKMNYLTRKSFNMLLERIKQLDSDKAYVDSLVKDKIDTL